MIEVTKPGDLNSAVYVGSCKNCGCEITCGKRDLIYEDCPYESSYVKCPTEGCPFSIYTQERGANA